MEQRGPPVAGRASSGVVPMGRLGAQQPLVGQPLLGDLGDVLVVDPDLHAELGELVGRHLGRGVIQDGREGGRIDLGEVVVPDDRRDVLGRLGLQVVVEDDEAELGDGRLGRAEPGQVDRVALERLGDRDIARGERLSAASAGR